MFGTSRINPGPAPLPPGSPLRIRTKDADQFNANSGDVEVRCRCHDTCEVCFALSRAVFTPMLDVATMDNGRHCLDGIGAGRR